MSTSRISSSIKLAFLASALFLAACNMPATQARKDGGSIQGSFYADEVTGNMVGESLRSDISLPTERVYAMKVCLRDLKHSKPVLNHTFLLEEINQEAKTDATGCLNWNEKVAFEYLAEPVFIKIERKIKSKGVHTGSYTISFAINPWDIENYHGSIDLSKNKVEPLYEKEEATARLSGKSTNKLYDLWVEDGRLFVNDEKYGEGDKSGFSLKYEFNVSPVIKTQKTSGEMSTYNLKHGLFSGRIEVIHRYFDGKKNKNVYDLIASGNVNNAKMEKGLLSFTKILTFYDGPPANGSLFVRLHLRPVKSVSNLKPYVGIFPSGDFRNLRGNLFLKVLPSPDFIKEIEEALPLNKAFIASTSGAITEFDTDDSTNKSNNSTGKPTKVASAGNIDFDAPVHGIQKASHKKEITYPAHLCYQNNLLGGAPIAFQKFKVYGFTQDENRPGPEKKDIEPSNKDGCVYWTDTIEYDIYECRHYFKGYVIIENADLNIREKRYYYVNPWDDYFGAKDANILKNPADVATSCDTDKPKRSEIVLTDVSFKTHDFSYKNSINSRLEFDAPKGLGLTLHPKVKIPSDVKKDYDNGLDDLLDGPYLLRVMVTRNAKLYPKLEVLFHQDIPVINNKGTGIYANIQFRLKDHRQYLTRNTLFLQLLPLKEKVVESRTSYSLKIKKEFENQDLESLVDYDTSVLTPTFAEEMIIDGESSRTLRPYSGSDYLKHLRVDFKDDNQDFNFSKIVSEFRSKRTQAAAKAAKDAVTLQQYAEKLNLDFLLDNNLGNLPFASWLKSAMNSNNATIDKDSASQLCNHWFNQYWKDKLKVGASVVKGLCSMASTENIRSFFDFDHIYYVRSVYESDKIGIGPEKSISLGTSFSIGISDSASLSHATGLAAKIGKSAPGIFSSVGAEIYHGIEFSRSTSASDSNSTSLSEGTSLSVTETQFLIRSNNYDYCLSIKPNARLFQDTGEVWFKQLWYGEISSWFVKSSLTAEDKLALTQKGIMVCRSQPTTKPFQFHEQYYWVKSPLSQNEIQDVHDERNQVFSMMIRGNQDYSRFKFLLTQKWQRPTNATQDGETKNYLNNMIQMQSFKPMAPSIHVYREAR